MKRKVAIIFLIIIISAAACHSPAKNELWSVRMAKSEMVRFPELWKLDFTPEPRWGYHQGLICKAMLDMWQYTGDDLYWNYAKNYMDTILTIEGKIKTYNVESYNIDMINAGKTLFTFLQETGDDRFDKAIQVLRNQMRTHPRTSEGGFWHKKRYPHQMWLDGLYMGAPFLAQYAKEFNEPELFDDAVHQILLVEKHHYDPETGLYYHGWDESRGQQWADEHTGQSPNFWGRSIGWFAMALVDVLDYLPAHHKDREEVITIVNKVARGIEQFQDTETGVWYQVVDQGDRQGNYLESSASGMFVYFLYKAVRKGYIDKKYLSVADKGYSGLLRTFIKDDPEGTVSITDGCVVAGLGGDPYRDGSFEYYVSERVRDNDPKAVAPFIWASMEHEMTVALRK